MHIVVLLLIGAVGGYYVHRWRIQTTEYHNAHRLRRIDHKIDKLLHKFNLDQ